MIPLLSRDAVRALDQHAITVLGVPGVVLMENAVLGAMHALFEAFSADVLARPLIVGGVGQNGGDAWGLARQLLVRGLSPRCVLVGDLARVQGDAKIQIEALRALGVPLEQCNPDDLGPFVARLREASLVVDGLFGTGLDRDVSGLYAEVIAHINASEKPVLALDLPSGLDANTGQVRGTAVRASCTVTFAAHKPGLHQFPGVELSGRVFLAPIGVPVAAQPWGIIEALDVAQAVPRRPANAHKGSSGRVVVFAGSAGKTGAAVLSATSALRAGAGLVTIATDPETQRALDYKVVEVMTTRLGETTAAHDALAFAANQNAAVLGPGFGLSPERIALIHKLARELPVPTVIDADGLTALGTELANLKDAARARVLTPHPGEAARLLGTSVSAVESDRYASAQRLAELSGQVVVLKGARTVIAAPDGQLRVCTSGTPALATGGTGDVLSGVVAALCVSLPAFTAAWVGVELHARAGALAAPSGTGLLAGEVAPQLPHALELCRT